MTAISFKCWTPSVPFKKTDNIISSDFAALKIFTPSYEKDSHICMDQLIANEYQRIWLIERDEWAHKTFFIKNGKTYIKRNSKIIPKVMENDNTKSNMRKKNVSQNKLNGSKDKNKNSKKH
ncbi:hypothetical protein PV328_005638 [Microctonus aethiopoides]|uniref:Uncharacterized protein n=1 Tax=Microctonus aethiopoides TaxID=144406 RepID=A0AA39FMP5_9HYME|nr:hypothetical protein PV328_005638 [Microctonus aethiopoides]